MSTHTFRRLLSTPEETSNANDRLEVAEQYAKHDGLAARYYRRTGAVEKAQEREASASCWLSFRGFYRCLLEASDQ